MFRQSRTCWLLKALLTLSGAKRTREIRRQAIIIINLYDGPYRADTGWPGVHPQHAYIREAGYIHQVNGPSRSLIATAFSSAVCRKRLRLRERSKRLVDLIRNIIDEAKVVEEYNLGPSANSSAEIADDDPFAEVFALRRLSDLSANSSANLAGIIGGLADEFAADLEIVEIFNRTPIYDHVAQMVPPEPPTTPPEPPTLSPEPPTQPGARASAPLRRRAALPHGAPISRDLPLSRPISSCISAHPGVSRRIRLRWRWGRAAQRLSAQSSSACPRGCCRHENKNNYPPPT